MSALVRRATATLLLLVAQATSARAQGPPPLPEMSLEELMAVTVLPVFGASERLQPVTEAPASVTIITADDIRRHGYRTLEDILRTVRGFVVTNDRNYTYVGIRGFSQPGDYNTRVLVLVNGHKINDNVYDQGFIGRELNLDVEVFDRVEVIRGPVSSLYGTSAFFAVINIITRQGTDIDGLVADVEAGSLGSLLGRVSFGRAFDNGLDAAISVKHETSDGYDRLYFEAFDTPSTHRGIAEALDAERASTVYGRVAWGGFTVTTTAGTRRKRVPTAAFGTIFNHHDPPMATTDSRLMLHATYARETPQTRIAVNASLDRVLYEGTYPFAGNDTDPAVPALINQDGGRGTRLGAGLTVTRSLPWAQTLTVGGEVLANVTQRQWSYYDDPTIESLFVDNTSHQSALYVQDEIRPAPWLLFNVGLRHDHYERFARTTPRGAVIVMPSPDQSFKYLYGEAFRAPNEYELWYYADASGSLTPETVRTHEIVWERYVGSWLRTSVSAYRTTANRLITLTSDNAAAWSLAFVNEGRMRAHGFELEAEARTLSGLQVVASASFQRGEDEHGTRPANWPSVVAEGRVSGPGPLPGSTWGAEVHHIGARDTLRGAPVDPYTLAHASLHVPIGDRLTLVAAGRNLFDVRAFDPASSEMAQHALEQNGRTARIGLRIRLGRKAVR